MKNRDKHIEKKVEQTLHALDGMERARPKPFLYTRIKARLEKGAEMPQQTSYSFSLFSSVQYLS
jgi:hypothetical protein